MMNEDKTAAVLFVTGVLFGVLFASSIIVIVHFVIKYW